MSKDELTLFTKGEMFLRYVSLQKDLKELEKDLDKEWKALQKAMEENGVEKISDDWGSITLATRKNYKEAGEVSDKFKKIVLDTTKVSAHATLTGELPEGVEVSESNYLVKKFK
jgi:hypothetical protein